MKFIYVFLFVLFFTIPINSQSPQLFNYQSVIRNSSGGVVGNERVALNISIVEGNVYGSIVYSEVFNVITNQFGLVNVKIGGGSVVAGDFSNINWGGSDFFINIAVDLEGGENFQDVGTTQLVSVPYALYAETTGDSYLNKNAAGHLFFNDGRIGIGTNDPQKALHIRRVTKNGQGVGQAQLLVEADSESDATIYLGYFPNDRYIQGQGKYWRINCDKPYGDFSIADEVDNATGGDGSVKRLIIKRNTGNVGIGVVNPKRKLHVSEAMRLEPQENAPENPKMGDMYFGKDGKLHLHNGTSWCAVTMTVEE